MIVFIHINKTGGNTLNHILRSTYGLSHCQVEPLQGQWHRQPFSADDLKILQKIYPTLNSIAGHRVYGHVELKKNGSDLQYITFMRDPVRRCASRFQFNVQARGKKDLVFEDWIQTDYPRNLATKWIAGEVDIEKAIRIIKEKNIFVCLTERFDESLVMLKKLVANDLRISYKRVNVARDNTIKNNLLENEKTRRMLEEAQQADIELYNYAKNELYPAYQKGYGPSLDDDVENYQQTQSHSFNELNITLSRIKQFALYKPLLYLNRKGVNTN